MLNTAVTGLDVTRGALTVSYGSHSVSYGLGNAQAGTFIHAVPDGHGGTDLVMTAIVGVQHLHRVWSSRDGVKGAAPCKIGGEKMGSG